MSRTGAYASVFDFGPTIFVWPSTQRSEKMNIIDMTQVNTSATKMAGNGLETRMTLTSDELSTGV